MFTGVKKGCYALLALSLMVAGLTACGKTETTGTGDKKTGGDKQLTISIFDRGKVVAEEGSYEENRWTKWMNEQTGINVKWIPIARNESQQKLNTLIAAGNAPDLIWEYDRNYIAALVNQGVIQPIDGYIEKYSSAYKKYLDNNADLKPFTNFNGKTYAATSKRSIDSIANHGMWIRQDWLDKLNLKAPTTDAELLEVAKAFTERDPDGNGVKDTYGLAIMQWQETLSAPFFANTIWYLEDGQLKYGPTLDRYADSLDFFSKLYSQKLIDSEFFTDKNFQNQKMLWVNGKAGILTNNWNEALNKDLLQNNPNAKPAPLEPIATKYGKNGLWQEVPANRYVVFSKEKKSPETAVEFLDWMIDKGWHEITYGVEGTHYKMVNGVPQTIDIDKKIKEVDYGFEYAIINQQDVQPEWFPLMAPQDPRSQELARQRSEALKVALLNHFRRDIPYEPSVPEITRLISEFIPKRDEIRMKVIVGGDGYTAQKGLEQIRSEWNRLGGQNAEKLANEWYQQNKAKFQ